VLTLALMAIVVATTWARGTKSGGPGVVEPG
jgi:hypothetical protein